MSTNTQTTTWLRPFHSTGSTDEGSAALATCMKCRSADVVVEYHPTVVNGFTCWNAVEALRMTGDLTEDEAAAARETEHLCRACIACGYAWCEETADAS